jgi:hypothetical protein
MRRAELLQQRQILGGNQVVVGHGVARRRRQLLSRSGDLRGREGRILTVQIRDAGKRIEVGQDIERVLRVVGPSVVLQCVDVGRVHIVGGRSGERRIQGGDEGAVEAFQ